MGHYLLGRLLQMILVLVLASIALFVMMRARPGDPALIYAGQDATDAELAAVRASLGLNQPLPVQYLAWARHALDGDLGKSFSNDYPVVTLLEQRLPATMELGAAAIILALLVSLPAGILAAASEGSAADYLITTLSGLGLAVPTFWFGIILILAFALGLHWLPASGYVQPFSRPGSFVQHLILPAITLALPTACALTRFAKSAVLDVLSVDHVRTARAKGLRDALVMRRHVVRNALITVITIVGLQVGRLLGGAVIIEAVFAWPGVGLLLLNAILNRDYAVVQGGLLALVVMFLVVNLLTHLLYGLVDPRIRLGAGSIAA